LRQRLFGRDIAMVAGANASAIACMHVSSANAVLAACAEERLDLADVEEHQKKGVPSDEATGTVVQDCFSQGIAPGLRRWSAIYE
jgi:hypothetical protein